MRPTRILPLACAVALACAAPAAQAAFPGANGRISFSSSATGAASRTGDIQTLAVPLGPWTTLTSDPTDDAQSAWSPDGKQIAFRSSRSGQKEVWLMNADGTNQHQLTTTPAPGDYSSQPAWSPDGKRLLFRSNRDGDADIWIMDADGTHVSQVANFPGDERYPGFSPDATRIAFRSDMDGDPEIYTMNPDATGLVQLTNNAIFDSAPAWSPDGKQIAFQRSPMNGNESPVPAGPGDIFVMNADGTNERQLTSDPAHDEGPAWSPDGTRIVFTSERSGNSDIWVMNADGSSPTQLTNAPTFEESPDWQPLPRAVTPAPAPPLVPGPIGAALGCTVSAKSAIRLPTLLRSGLKLKITCRRPASARAAFALTSAAAKRAKLQRVTLARTSHTRGTATFTLTLRVSKLTGAQLHKLTASVLRGLKPALLVVFKDAAGASASVSRSVRLAP